MLCVFFVLLSGASGVLPAAPEVRAGRPGGGLQEVNHLAVLLDRLERLEGQFDEEKRRWQKVKQDWESEKQFWQKEKQDWQNEKQDWQNEKKDWQNEKQDWQKEKQDWQKEKQNWQKEKQDWQKEKQDWQKEKQDWQKEKQHWQKEKRDWRSDKDRWEQLSRHMQSQILSLQQHQVDVPETGGSTDRDDPFPTAKVPESDSTSNEVSPETPWRPQDHSVFARSDDVNALQPVISEMNQRLGEVAAEVQALKNANSQQDQAIQQASTSTFVRWGSSSCPGSAELVYSGIAGGGWYASSGSTTTAFCLPLNPSLATQSSKPSQYDWMHGAEYQTELHHYQTDPVCAVCRTHRPTTVMMPATNVCESGWTLEYSGYVMGSAYNQPSGHEAVCMDSGFESRAGSSHNDNGFLFFLMFTKCGSLPCPPYEADKVVTCAVCSK